MWILLGKLNTASYIKRLQKEEERNYIIYVFLSLIVLLREDVLSPLHIFSGFLAVVYPKRTS